VNLCQERRAAIDSIVPEFRLASTSLRLRLDLRAHPTTTISRDRDEESVRGIEPIAARLSASLV